MASRAIASISSDESTALGPSDVILDFLPDKHPASALSPDARPERRRFARWPIKNARAALRHARAFEFADVALSVRQCTLTACSSLLQAFATAASRLSVSMIGVPSAACSANSFRPGAIFGACGKQPRHVLGADLLDVGDLAFAEALPAPRARRRGFVSNATCTFSSWSRLLTETKRSSPLLVPLFVFIDGDCLNDPLRFRPGEIDRQQAVLQIRSQHLHPLRQHEGALEVARGDAAMDVLPGLVVLLPARGSRAGFPRLLHRVGRG